jgi:hypothetical protein
VGGARKIESEQLFAFALSRNLKRRVVVNSSHRLISIQVTFAASFLILARRDRAPQSCLL